MVSITERFWAVATYSYSPWRLRLHMSGILLDGVQQHRGQPVDDGNRLLSIVGVLFPPQGPVLTKPRGFEFYGPNTEYFTAVGQCYTSFPSGQLTYAQLSAPGTYTITSTNLPAGSIAGFQVNGYIFKNTAFTSFSNLPTGTTTTTPASTSNPEGERS